MTETKEKKQSTINKSELFEPTEWHSLPSNIVAMANEVLDQNRYAAIGQNDDGFYYVIALNRKALFEGRYEFEEYWREDD